MKSKFVAVLLSALSLTTGAALQAQEAIPDRFRGAEELYDHGMFERAGSIDLQGNRGRAGGRL